MARTPASSIPTTGLRRRLKGPGAALLRRALRARRGQIGVALAYHAVQADEPRPVSVVPAIGRERFQNHLRHLRRHYRVVGLPGLIEAAVRRRRGEPYPVALTFDDDLGEHLEHAAPLLAAEGLPATFFLCGRDLLGDGEFWWETLQRAADAGASISELPPTAATGPGPASSAAGLRARAASIEVLPPGERDAATAKLIALAGERTPERRLGERQIAELTRRGHSVGFHTRRHQLLTGLDDDALRSALNDGREQLARATGTPIEMIAYPHGRVDQRVADVAREEGFATGFATGGAGITPDSDPLRLDRLPADELSVSELAAAIPAAIARARSR